MSKCFRIIFSLEKWWEPMPSLAYKILSHYKTSQFSTVCEPNALSKTFVDARFYPKSLQIPANTEWGWYSLIKV